MCVLVATKLGLELGWLHTGSLALLMRRVGVFVCFMEGMWWEVDGDGMVNDGKEEKDRGCTDNVGSVNTDIAR